MLPVEGINIIATPYVNEDELGSNKIYKTVQLEENNFIYFILLYFILFYFPPSLKEKRKRKEKAARRCLTDVWLEGFLMNILL